MGRLNPLPFREVKRRLEAAGFEEASQKGSHVKFVRRTGEIVDTAIVPRKSEVAVGTLCSIRARRTSTPNDGKNSANNTFP
ncbi:MAG: type II toxin-antitoxin system HicA family toxin [Acidobacteriaceae bacterium]